jgi:methionyl-tRNA formyltransferase
MLNGEEQVGVTIHEMAEGLDSGDILVQEMVSVRGVTSLHEMYQRTIAVGPRLLLKAIKMLSQNDQTRIKNEDNQSSKFKFPTKADGLAFRKKGLTIY